LAREKSPKIREKDIAGLKYFKALGPLLERLHSEGTDRDRAGNRELYYDQYVGLILLYFFTPVLTSLRGIQQAGELEKVQKLLGCSRPSLGSLSEAASVFDPEPLKDIIVELGNQALPLRPVGPELKALENLTAFDGTLLPALPRMAWALWVDNKNRAAKVHMTFEVLKGIPSLTTVTDANASEKEQLRGMLQPNRLYVHDRGLSEYKLFQDIIDAGSSFIGRLRDNAVWTVIEERPVSEEARKVGVQRDLVVRLGCEGKREDLRQPVRVVEVHAFTRDCKGQPTTLLLVTDRMDLPSELVALGYRFRWSIELFFRWFKRVLGCLHLLSNSLEGIQIQVYVALIASLLITIWTGRKPTKRTFEMLCFFFAGWASEDEVVAHLGKLGKAKA